jgi:hypothetical protein
VRADLPNTAQRWSLGLSSGHVANIFRVQSFSDTTTHHAADYQRAGHVFGAGGPPVKSVERRVDRPVPSILE